MRIKSLHLKHIGVFDDNKIDFPESRSKDIADIYIFTGTNGSGKSTILFALASAFDSFTDKQEHKNNTSNFFYKRFKYFEKNKEHQYKSEVVIDFEKDASVKIYGCPICQGIHRETQNSKIKTYSTFILSQLPHQQEFEFVAFAYSGYRYVKSETINTIKIFDGNPLAQSLEFVKNRSEFSSVYSINQWILNNYSNEALLLKMGQVEESKKFASSLENFKKFVSDIIEKEIDFVVKLNPTRLYVKIDEEELEFDVLPDGLKSLISWIGDLMMVMDQLKWKDNTPIFERKFLLFLDEIEVHLHPVWQRKILPVIQKLFTNAQIFVSTHSPFIANSVDGAFIYELEYDKGRTEVKPPSESKTSNSISYTLKKVFGIDSEFGTSLENQLKQFYQLRDTILKKDTSVIDDFIDLKNELLQLDDLEVNNIIEFEVNQLFKITKLKELVE